MTFCPFHFSPSPNRKHRLPSETPLEPVCPHLPPSLSQPTVPLLLPLYFSPQPTSKVITFNVLTFFFQFCNAEIKQKNKKKLMWQQQKTSYRGMKRTKNWAGKARTLWQTKGEKRLRNTHTSQIHRIRNVEVIFFLVSGIDRTLTFVQCVHNGSHLILPTTRWMLGIIAIILTDKGFVWHLVMNLVAAQNLFLKTPTIMNKRCSFPQLRMKQSIGKGSLSFDMWAFYQQAFTMFLLSGN